MRLKLIISLLIISIFLISGCEKCPETCEDNDSTTNDICSEETAFQCQHIKVCPESCEDNNKCTKDSCSEETNLQCKHEEIKPCCENNICETNEYKACSSDCPISDLSKFVLNTNDVSDEWEIETRGERSLSEISNKYKQYGWKKGYTIVMRKKDSADIKITNWMSIYPIENIVKIIQLSEGEAGSKKLDDGSTENKQLVEGPKYGDKSIIYRDEIESTFTYSLEYCAEFIENDILEGICTNDLELTKELIKKLDDKF